MMLPRLGHGGRPHSSQALAGRSIVIVEEQFVLADFSAQQVVEAGGTVLGPYASALSALSATMDVPPAAALLDLNLNGEPCFRLADALASIGIPLVFLTGYGPEIAPIRHARAPWLTKPSSAKAIVDALVFAISRG